MKVKYSLDSIENIYEDVNPKYIPSLHDKIFIDGRLYKQCGRVYHPNLGMLIIYLEHGNNNNPKL